MPSSKPRFADSVFINCPFDKDYWPIFEAIIFSIVNCGFVPRCSLEIQDSGETRYRNIQNIIKSSKYSIHDISRVQLTPLFPRFNMPFELGLDLGCRTYGANQLKRKKCLILDTEKYRYQQFISDIAGQDIKAHKDSPDKVIDIVRNWLRVTSKRKNIPGPTTIKSKFSTFSENLPELCDNSGLDRNNLEFIEYVALVEFWAKTK